MADTKISALTDGTTAAAADRIPVARDPTGTPLSRYITPAYIRTYITSLANTWSEAQSISGANMGVTLGNGGWGGTDFAVPYLRPTTSGGHIAFDIMPNGGPDDVWIDICSHDITNGSGNYETLKLFKAYNGDAKVQTTKAGTGTKRSLQIGGQTTKLTYGASDTVGWTVDANGALVAGTSTGIQAPTVANTTLASISTPTSTSSGFFTVNGFDWGYTRAGSDMWRAGFNVFRFAPDTHLSWSGTTGDSSASSDVGLIRTSAGVVKVTNGSTGFGSLALGTASSALLVGTHSAIGAETVTGYITIKDSGGTDRKIAVVS